MSDVIRLASENYVNQEIQTKLSELENDNNYAKTEDIPTKISELENDVDYAKTSDIPINVSELENDANYLNEESDPTVASHVKIYLKKKFLSGMVLIQK